LQDETRNKPIKNENESYYIDATGYIILSSFWYKIYLTDAQMHTVMYQITIMNSNLTLELLFFMSYLKMLHSLTSSTKEMHCVSSRIMEERAL
jgi:hypothetical protein